MTCWQRKDYFTTVLVPLINLLVCTLLFAYHQYQRMLSQFEASKFSSSETENLQYLADCIQNSSVGQTFDYKCRIPAQSVKELMGSSFHASLQSLANENYNQFTKYNVYNMGCYRFPDLDERLPPVELNKSDTLGSMRRCGVFPELQSKEVHVAEDGLPIPKVVYYVYFRTEDYDINFLQYTSLLSVHKFVKAKHIFWVTNHKPSGKLWEKLLKEVPNVYYLHFRPPWVLYNTVIQVRVVQTDIVRMQLLHTHGGIYLDDDMYALNSFDPIRKYPFVMSNELSSSLINCILLAEPQATFLKLWGETYKTIRGDRWRRNSMQNPKLISQLYPHLIHIENDTLAYPSWPHVAKLYIESFNWRKVYSLHVQGKGKGQHYRDMFPYSSRKASLI